MKLSKLNVNGKKNVFELKSKCDVKFSENGSNILTIDQLMK